MNATDDQRDPAILPNVWKSRKAKYLGISVLAFIFVYSIAGFFVLPHYARKIALEKLSAQLGRVVRIDSVGFNPYTFAGTIKGFEIKEDDGHVTFISFGSLHTKIKVFSSLVKRGPVIGEIKLEAPHIHFIRTDINTYSFSSLVDRLRGKPDTGVPEAPAKPFVFAVSDIRIIDGSIEFEDRLAATKHEITKINLSIPFISDFPSYVDSSVQPSLSALINGRQVEIKGASKVFSDSRETSLDIAIKDIDIPYYLAYAPMKLNVKALSGTLDVAMKLAYRQFHDRAPLLTLSGESTVRNLSLVTVQDQKTLLNIPLFSVKDISLDLEKKKVVIEAIATQKGLIALSRLKDGRMNVDSLTKSPAPAAAPVAAPTEAGTPPWTVTLKSLVVDDYTVAVTDQVPVEPFNVAISAINFDARNISTEKGEKGVFSLSMRIDRKGSATVNGDLTLAPFGVNLTAGFKNIRLNLLQPYVEEKARILIADGLLSANGNLRAERSDSGELNATVKAKLGVTRFSMLDKASAEDLIKWDSLFLEGIEAHTRPLSLRIRQIALSNFSSRIVINSDKTINLLEAVKAPSPHSDTVAPGQEAGKKSTPEPGNQQSQAQSPAIRIDTITLQGGSINVTDDSIRPRFTANLVELGGHISGLSSQEDVFGDIELSGKYDQYAPLSITGKVNPLRSNLFIDLNADFKDMDLTSVGPYSGRYAGYAIQKGKLSFHLQYHIDKNRLEAKNNIFIDQFNFGDHVESADATSLPVRLAVALLKDRNGEIHLDIPVSGELNDPKFSVGGVILKVIVNLLEKAATSPFALLGALLGSDEQLGYAEFEAGSAILTTDTMKKLDVLEKALHDRPALKMDIIGHADLEKDRAGLTRNLLSNKVRAQKIRELAGKKEEIFSLESVTVTAQEYPLLLKQAYKEERFPKPRTALGFAKDLPVPEMEKLMLTNLKVTDEDLKTLAAGRARAVRDYLLRTKQVEPERLYIVESGTFARENKNTTKGGVDNCRAEFQLE